MALPRCYSTRGGRSRRSVAGLRRAAPAPLAVPELQVAILCRGRAGVICLVRPLQPLRQLQPSADLPQPCLRGLVGRALPPTALPRLPVRPVPLSLRHLPAEPPNRAASFGASEE